MKGEAEKRLDYERLFTQATHKKKGTRLKSEGFWCELSKWKLHAGPQHKRATEAQTNNRQSTARFLGTVHRCLLINETDFYCVSAIVQSTLTEFRESSRSTISPTDWWHFGMLRSSFIYFTFVPHLLKLVWKTQIMSSRPSFVTDVDNFCVLCKNK